MGKMLGGGVESVVMNYYRHIDRERVQFDFLVDADSALVPKEEIEFLGGRVFQMPPYQRLAACECELEQLFHAGRWPVAHSHVSALSVFSLCAAKCAGVRICIAHSHSSAGKGEAAKNAAKTVLKRFSNVYPMHRMARSRYAGGWLFGKGAKFEVVYDAIGRPAAWADALSEVEPGERVPVSMGDFANYDIDRVAERLAALCLDLAKGIRHGW